MSEEVELITVISSLIENFQLFCPFKRISHEKKKKQNRYSSRKSIAKIYSKGMT